MVKNGVVNRAHNNTFSQRVLRTSSTNLQHMILIASSVAETGENPAPNMVPLKQDSQASSSAKGSTATCSTFTCFPELPIELRLKVWGFVSFQPRNIPIWARSMYKHPASDDAWITEYGSTFVPPSILHASHESRMEALKHYTLEFGMELQFEQPTISFSAPTKVYVNWEVDTVCVVSLKSFHAEGIMGGRIGNYPWGEPFESLLYDDLLLEQTNMQSLAINISPGESREDSHVYVTKIDGERPDLKDLVVFEMEENDCMELMMRGGNIRFESGAHRHLKDVTHRQHVADDCCSLEDVIEESGLEWDRRSWDWCANKYKDLRALEYVEGSMVPAYRDREEDRLEWMKQVKAYLDRLEDDDAPHLNRDYPRSMLVPRICEAMIERNSAA